MKKRIVFILYQTYNIFKINQILFLLGNSKKSLIVISKFIKKKPDYCPVFLELFFEKIKDAYSDLFWY